MSTIMKIKVKQDKDRVFSICMAMYYAIAVLTRMSSTLFSDSEALKLIIRLGTYAVIIVTLLKLIEKKYNILVLFFIEILLVFLFLISNLMGYINKEWFTVYKLIATTYIPLALAAYNITNRKILLKALYVVALVSVPLLSLTALLSYKNWSSSYDMSLGYIMIFSVLILLADCSIEFKVYDIVLAVIMGLFTLFIGSRGPFICVIVFIFIELLLSKRYSTRKKTFIIVSMIGLGSIIAKNFDNILMWVYQMSVKLGFNSRSIYLLMQGEAVSEDSGRSGLQEHYMELINQKPVIGYGVMGNWLSETYYPHNIVLEFLLSFGCLLGSILLIIILFLMINAIKTKNKYDSALAIIFISYCTHLFVSGTYLKVWQFFVCIALCIPHGTSKNSLTVRKHNFSDSYRG